MHPEINLQSPLLCVIPARGGSKRLPRKNIANLDGKPMLAYTIEAAQKSGLFERVNVSTEDPEIAEIAQQYGACVPYTRPADLATDQATVAQVCCHMLDFFASQGQVYETVCILLPSAPLRIAQDITGTYQRFRESGADYAMAVTSYIYPPWQALVERNGLLQPYWAKRPPTKKVKKFHHCGSILERSISLGWPPIATTSIFTLATLSGIPFRLNGPWISIMRSSSTWPDSCSPTRAGRLDPARAGMLSPAQKGEPGATQSSPLASITGQSRTAHPIRDPDL